MIKRMNNKKIFNFIKNGSFLNSTENNENSKKITKSKILIRHRLPPE